MHSVRSAPAVERLAAAVMARPAAVQAMHVGDEITDARAETLRSTGVPAVVERMTCSAWRVTPLVTRDDVDAARGWRPRPPVVQARGKKFTHAKRPSPHECARDRAWGGRTRSATHRDLGGEQHPRRRSPLRGSCPCGPAPCSRVWSPRGVFVSISLRRSSICSSSRFFIGQFAADCIAQGSAPCYDGT